MMKVFSISEKGKRENNEDFILSSQVSSDCSLFLVADGMGGYSYGEIASSIACSSISEYIQSNFEQSNKKQLIIDALDLANQKIKKKREEFSSKMGTTIAGTLIAGNNALCFWLGDVRLYHFRNNEIIFQSEDHSLINEMKKKGDVTIKEIERFGNIVTKSLSGTTYDEEPSIIELSLIPEDILVLCTDGLWQKIDVLSVIDLSQDEIQNQISEYVDLMDDNYSFLKISV